MNPHQQDEAFWDDLAPIVDGEANAIDRHADRLADSDAHRDARHEAAQAAALLPDASADYDHPPDFEERLLSALDERHPQASPTLPAAPEASTTATRVDTAPATTVDAPPRSKSRAPLIAIIGGLAVAASALAVFAAGGAFLWMSTSGNESELQATAALEGRLTRFTRAADDNGTGISIRADGEEGFSPLALGSELPAGATLRTDDRTRAEVELSDGSTITLNHDTEVAFDAARPRALRLERGELVAEVAPLQQGPLAVYETPTGTVEVLGTKFVLTAGADASSVRVTRGKVRAVGANGSAVEVAAGQEGTLPISGEVTLAPALGLAHSVAWSELGTDEGDADMSLRGIGELRARRPGEREDEERPLALAEHKATVRVVGNVARTEIEETFRNDSDVTLEGIYRFPLPPDARIASLQLLVEDEWEEGAIVERNRAQKIWRGVIRNATPQRQRQQQQEEFIWVPGPWRDPALLEWQRGGQFELRIFPIPANGARSVRIAYTQTIAPRGSRGRRFVLPLAHSGDESTRVGRFEADVRIAGHDGDARVQGYDMTESPEDNAERFRFTADNFLPAGDLLVDYQLPNPDAEIRWWTFQGDASVAPPEDSRERNDEVLGIQRSLAEDDRPFVVFSLRPELPAWSQSESRDYVFVVDSSQSMVGERYERASELLSTVVREMDRRDRFTVLACDATCRSMSEDMVVPNASSADEAKTFLRGVEPAGASNLVAAFREAARHSTGGDRPTHVLYLGDGIATSGPRRLASLHAELESLVANRDGLAVSAVGIGGDADTASLEEIARAGGGHYVPYVPGERLTSAALAILESSYGVSLTGAHLELPDGVTDIAPRELPNLRAGQEVLVTGRLAEGTEQLAGSVRLTGKVSGRDFEQEYPVELAVSTTRGNAFVPRQWAAASIHDLERKGRGEDEARIVALSKAYGVMSRHTSLLVLESEAMFRAFRVDRGQPALQWTGDEDTEMGESEGLNELAGTRSANADVLGGVAGFGRRAGGSLGDSLDDMATRPAPSRRARRSSSGTSMASVAARPAAPQVRAEAFGAPEEEANVRDELQQQQARRRGPGRVMRREWYRVGRISTETSVSPAEARRVAEAEAALRENPDSRDRHRDLVRALSVTGDLDRALDVVDDWIERDRMDPEALIMKADLLARRGQKEQAVRLFSGVVDLRPDDRGLQERVADAFARLGAADRTCSHRVALAELWAGELSSGGEGRVRRRTSRDALEAAGAALRCERGLGRDDSAARLLGALPDDDAREGAEEEAAELARPERVRGDTLVRATWQGSADIDVSLIDRRGNRISWMGGRRNVVGEDASAVGRERLGIRWTPTGSYTVEISRGGGSSEPITGQLDVRVLGERRRIPFTLTGDREVVGELQVRRESRLVPVGFFR